MLSKIKSLAGDTVIYGLSTVIIRFLTFLLTPLYTNFLTTSQYDFLIFIFSFTTFLSFLYSVGMDLAYLRFFNQEEDDSKKAFTLSYAAINITGLVFTILIVLFSYDLTYLSGYSEIPNARVLIIMAALIPFLDVLVYIPFNHLRMTKQAVKLSVIRVIVIIFTIILNVIFLTQLDYQAEGAILAQVLANVLIFIILIPVILDNLEFKLDWNLFKEMFRYAYPTIPASLASIFLIVGDRPILKFLTGSDLAITTYQVNYRLGIPMLIFVSVFDFAWQPFYLKHYKDSDAEQLFGRILTYYTLVSGFIFLFLTFFMPYIVQFPFPGGTLINSKYWTGMDVLPVIVLSYFFYGLYVNFSVGAIVQKKTYATSLALVFGAVINIISNFLLIPVMGYFGAAISIVAAYFAAMVIIYFFSHKFYPVKYEWKRVLIIVSNVVLIYLAVYFLNRFGLDKWLDFTLKLSALGIFIILLKLFGLFNTGEKRFIRNMFGSRI